MSDFGYCVQAKLILTGSVVLVFVVLHLRAFRFGTDGAHPAHICAATGLTPPTSAPRLGSPRRFGADMFIGTDPDAGPWGSLGVRSRMRDLYRLQLELFSSLPQARPRRVQPSTPPVARPARRTTWRGRRAGGGAGLS